MGGTSRKRSSDELADDGMPTSKHANREADPRLIAFGEMIVAGRADKEDRRRSASPYARGEPLFDWSGPFGEWLLREWCHPRDVRALGIPYGRAYLGLGRRSVLPPLQAKRQSGHHRRNGFPQGSRARERDRFFRPRHARIEVGGILQNVSFAKKSRSLSCSHPIDERDAVFVDSKLFVAGIGAY